MRNYLFIIVMFTTLVNAQNTTISNINIRDIVVLDSIQLNSNTNLPPFYPHHRYIPFYIGPKRDTIHLKKRDLNKQFAICYMCPKRNYRSPKIEKEISLFIDTTQFISYNNHTVRNLIGDSAYFKSINQQSYILFLENISSDTLRVGSSLGLRLFLVGQSYNQTYKPFHLPINGCGTGITSYILPPNHIMLIPLPLSDGNFLTTFKLAFAIQGKEIVYSNEFYGNIDSSFFEQKNSIINP